MIEIMVSVMSRKRMGDLVKVGLVGYLLLNV